MCWSPGSVTLRAGAGSAALTVHTADDSVAEDDGTVTAAVQPGTGYQIGDPGSAGVRVVDNDRAPIVPLGFAYVPFDEPDDRVDTNDPPRRTPESDWPHRFLGLPFLEKAFVANSLWVRMQRVVGSQRGFLGVVCRHITALACRRWGCRARMTRTRWQPMAQRVVRGRIRCLL